ncbi:MAG: 3-oxoacyl-ACP reductase FabG [Leucobacter sp.]
MSRFTQKTAIVTGGAQGIGKAIVSRLTSEGANIGIFDLNIERAEQSAAELNAKFGGSGSVSAYRADVTDEESVKHATSQFVADHGRIDLLVNNAGITRDNLFFRMQKHDWDAVLATNLTSMFIMTHAVQTHMVSQNYGKIVSLSSRSALGNRGQANYAAAKAGVQGLTATLAIELGRYNINVNAVAPGFIETEMTDSTARRVGKSPEEYRAEVASRTPLGRVGTPDNVASAVAFLLSEDAAYVSGQTLYINGGAR